MLVNIILLLNIFPDSIETILPFLYFPRDEFFYNFGEYTFSREIIVLCSFACDTREFKD